jgi:hypothetical protein
MDLFGSYCCVGLDLGMTHAGIGIRRVIVARNPASMKNIRRIP